MTARAPIGTQRRWLILQRDDFTCQFCGARPGNDRLHVDHLIPHSKGGSDHDNNLTTACERCNQGKSDRIAVPRKMLDGFVARDGWPTWKRWGQWHLMIADEGDFVALSFDPDGQDYWIALNRIHEGGWHHHLKWKLWMREDDEIARIDAFHDKLGQERRAAGLPAHYGLVEFLQLPDAPDERLPAHGKRWLDFCDAIDFARTLIRKVKR